MLQWHITGGSPATAATIKATSDFMVGGGMTVPIQRGSMAILQPPRSRFMINDILAGSDGGGGGPVSGLTGHGTGSVRRSIGRDDDRSPSPQGPRDLSLPPGSRHDDSDSDSSGQLDDQSICSNGMFDIDFI